jgi:hypothetical protein
MQLLRAPCRVTVEFQRSILLSGALHLRSALWRNSNMHNDAAVMGLANPRTSDLLVALATLVCISLEPDHRSQPFRRPLKS